MCLRPQEPETVKLGIFNLCLKFTENEKTIFKGEWWCSSCSTPAFLSSSHAALLPGLPQFESNHQCTIGSSNHVTHNAPKSTAFWDWLKIFPWELLPEPVQCECVCVSILGKNLPPPLPLFPTSFPTSFPLSPFLSSFFHHLPSFETQYHTLDSLCCHGKEHSFFGMATRTVRMQEVPWKAQKEQRANRVRICSNVATT